MLLILRIKLWGKRRVFLAISFRAVLTLIAGVAITIALFLWMHHREQELERSYFRQRAGAHVAAFQEQLNEAVETLELVNQSFKTFAPVRRHQFEAFTRPLLARYPYIQNFSFHRIVSHKGRAAFEAEMQKDYPDFAVTDIVGGRRVTAPTRLSYRVIAYLEPMVGNELVFGLDAAELTSDQEAAIKRAAETGKASATKLFALPQRGNELGFGIAMPVYRKDDSPRAGVPPRENIVGYTMAILRATDFVEKNLSAANLLTAPADISVYIGQFADDNDLVYRIRGAESPGTDGESMAAWLNRDEPRVYARTIDFAGTPWHVVISAPSMRFTTHHLGSLLTLLGGMLVTLLAAASMQSLAMRSHHTQQLVNKRTAELKVSNRLLTEDIAARKETEQRLQHTQHILTNAQKTAHLGSWVFHPRTHELECCEEFFRICGLKPQSVKADLDFAVGIVHPDDRALAEEAIRATLNEGKKYRIEKRIVRPDGTIRYVASRGELIRTGPHGESLFIGSYLDITEQKMTEFALRESQEKLRELAAHLERIREEERQRIAREIHDELGALLTGIKAHLSVAIDTAAADAPSNALLTDAAHLADVATEAVRRVVADLRPSVLDQLGVWEAIEWYVDGIEQRTGLSCECTIEAHVAAIDLLPQRSAMVFRVVQEALTNAVRHAGASRVTVRAMREEQSIVVLVEDDGKGLDTRQLVDSQSWGIVGMHERARYFGGELTITGKPGQGTTVALRLPLEDLHDR
jgi:PAS domain S-box-containing protein